MARVPEIHRLKKEDFDSKDQELVGKLAFPINTFMEQTQAVLNGGVDFLNLNMELVEVDIIRTSTNTPKITTKINTDLKSKVAGVICINAQNIDASSPTSTVTGQPFIQFTENSGLLTVNYIFGLPQDVKFRLRLLVIGF